MKVSNITIAFLGMLLIAACGNTGKKEKSTTESSGTDVKLEATSTMDLEQKGDYTQLYTPNADCKLTTSQLAESLGYSIDQVEEQSNYQGNCWYKVTHPGNFTVNYGISLEKWGDKNIVEDEIQSGLKNEMVNVRISESGDTYIKRHPVQGFLLLLNTNYGNPIKISYSYLNTSGPKLTDSQSEEQKQNTYKIANYLIGHYQK
ncbi:hypothetical protein [Flagellimonas sp. MMG031]|uniref:Lipoprotein n=1 Tax=Flagellimonas sp. MMG031 TaxID=3158549 RepID=A0AAU7N2J9_9FLAO